MKLTDGRKRVVIEEVSPQVDGGRHPVRRVVSHEISVRAAIFADGHDLPAARLLFRPRAERRWRSAPMHPDGNDLWEGSFAPDKIGPWVFTIQGWIDRFETWASDLKKRLGAQAAQADSDNRDGVADAYDLALAFRTGATLVHQAALRARGADSKKLAGIGRELNRLADENRTGYDYPLDEDAHRLMACYPDLRHATQFARELPVWADRERACFSSWYEMFPRSASPVPGKHGTFADVELQLREIAGMGFDILYLPPIHPIGRTFRKGPNNTANAGADAPGSPWAIGDRESVACASVGASRSGDCGGHKSIHPDLGTFADFDRLVSTANSHGVEIALDIAFQCSPDHPWVTEHPSWFVIRPDGSIQYAENPPKKYQDIYPLNFESPDWRSLWGELYSVFEFWIGHGVRVFRVDNPHTKALPFWEWCLDKINSRYPDAIFLAEAFTRPHLMYGLAKRGFTQSYTYFTWRNSKAELQSYLEEITRPPISDFFRPNLWPNTPDILHRTLQEGGRPAFMHRVILAATLSSNYGIYGPAYELAESAPARPGPGKTETEEYLDSEKYEIRQRNRNAPGSLVPLITALNRIRRANPALHDNGSLHFHRIDNPNLLCYSKATAGFENTILIAVNLDAFNEQAGWTDLDLDELGVSPGESFNLEDLLTGAHYAWRDRRNYVALRPGAQPAHIFRLTR
ncbi:MAG TPA: alpha-1,4-glucan--maltose-1-phosphate maltosyltransferase [Terracidiphilus sp.]|nr:alpha-1,4-glucan--maltose-1-phosphate maltosyltransferase [Terracidiphilus sp.]